MLRLHWTRCTRGSECLRRFVLYFCLLSQLIFLKQFKAVDCDVHVFFTGWCYRMHSMTSDCWDLLNPHVLLKLVSAADIIKASFFFSCASHFSLSIYHSISATVSVFFICILSCSSLFFCACLMSGDKKKGPI